jgi:hypothetical protein
MTSRLSAWRDRLGQAVLILLCSATTASASGSYTARRFDVYATVQSGGALDVRETIQFEFQTGTMSRVWREIPASRTDGIDIIEASMDGGTVQPDVRRGTRTRVEWQFPPTGPSTHTFVLHYIVRGIVYREGDRDVLRWRALPVGDASRRPRLRARDSGGRSGHRGRTDTVERVDHRGRAFRRRADRRHRAALAAAPERGIRARSALGNGRRRRVRHRRLDPRRREASVSVAVDPA